MKNPARRSSLTAVAAAALIAGSAAAQQYPVKPVRIVVPFPPGGPTDTHSRWAGQQMHAAFNQPVVVENRAGARVAKAAGIKPE